MKLMVTALLLAGLNAYGRPTTRWSRRLVPFGLPCTDRVWVRVPQPVGSFSTTWSMLVLAPRSIWAHCGKELPALSQ